MTIMRMTKKCPKCKKEYAFNPDVGKGLFCPYCAGSGLPLKQEEPGTWEKIREIIKNLFQ